MSALILGEHALPLAVREPHLGALTLAECWACQKAPSVACVFLERHPL